MSSALRQFSVGKAGFPAGIYLDNFERPNTSGPDGLGSMPDGPEWNSLSGSWEITSNRAVTSTARTNNPIAVVSLLPDAELRAGISSGSGGDALYFRVVDADNWWRIRQRRWTTTTTNYRTEYLWRLWWLGNVPGSLTVGGHTHSTSSAPTMDRWSTSNTEPDWPDILSEPRHTHGTVDEHRHERVITSSSQQLLSDTRQVSTGTTTTTYYRIFLERCIDGSISSRATTNNNTSILRVVLDGPTIQAYRGTTLWRTETDSTHQDAFLHGIGRGESPVNAQQFNWFEATVGGSFSGRL